MPLIMKYGEEKIMEITTEKKGKTLAWAVLSKAINGHSEVIKVTNYDEADKAVQENPGLFYKSGPFML